MTDDEGQDKDVFALARALAARLVAVPLDDLEPVTIEELARRAVEPQPAELVGVEDQAADVDDDPG